MPKTKIIEKLKLPNVYILLLIVFLSCTLLIFINFYTIEILSANRAYVNGESHYSKGQKDAVRHLITYLYTGDKEQWELYKKEIKVPQGVGEARILLLSNGDVNAIKEGLRDGRNNEKDLDDMIWLFRNFKSVSFLAKAISIWEEADNLVDQLEVTGGIIDKRITNSSLNEVDKKQFLNLLSALSDKLTIKELEFSNTLGEGTRAIKNQLILTNIIFILIIVSSVCIYYSIMVKKIMISKKEVEAKNENLILANRELDRFVYSASHDLRSPITSLKGLIEITQMEDDLGQIREYLNLMKLSLIRQDQFISDIIDYSKNKRKGVVLENISLIKLFEGAIIQHTHIENADRIIVDIEILVDVIKSDSLRLKIIINNLLSNAIKYADESKEEMRILIKTYEEGDFYKIEVIDNGIGIVPEFKEHIFEMFYVVDSNKGSGLGLYILKEAVKSLNGTIEVESEFNIGSKFTLTIPKLE
ncbi:HAMP domain-containing sensor histidine kinase [Flavobacterium branchiarum]|uniref:histidine kinase n=1 Tax=Flavobacterium branchiarum TaxID=1114870 RepID=A0ABV5FG97_9FLAO|nr:HAMP domain-containing sensor histidine kinase [Flavobacterium branchiarum]MDN3672867.1 HAMP domain-containing sensor histidine kinase [Flavobacterium branchiarum]